jgi:hypothetical protein
MNNFKFPGSYAHFAGQRAFKNKKSHSKTLSVSVAEKHLADL